MVNTEVHLQEVTEVHQAEDMEARQDTVVEVMVKEGHQVVDMEHRQAVLQLTEQVQPLVDFLSPMALHLALIPNCGHGSLR
jgi:hypothetical protein